MINRFIAKLANLRNTFNTAFLFGFALLLTGTSVATNAYASGFQGLPWGATVASIKSKFPAAQQDSPDTELYPICKDANGDTYLCTIGQQLCLSMGRACHPSLRIKRYFVGNYASELTFDLSRDKNLRGVSLDFSGELVGKTTAYGKELFEFLKDSLQRKYGEPEVSEPYQLSFKRIGSAYGAYAFYQWKRDGTLININFSARFDPNTGRYVDIGGLPKIDVTYSPVINEAASKL